MFQNTSWQTIEAPSLDLTLHFRGMVYSSVVKLQMSFAVQGSELDLFITEEHHNIFSELQILLCQ